MSEPAIALLALTLVLSPVTFLAYGLDKRRARRGGRRIPERTLQGLAALGGWLGALAGRRLFRHKTRKTAFSICLYTIAAGHLALWVLLLGA